MENSTMLAGSETHGFRTIEELNVNNIMEEAKARWLRPNEIYAILRNYKYFTINAKPVNLPRSGTIVLFDRKMLRSFRKDGHNWKKKKDRKTVKEAHEHLKVGNKERIHVYYAHGEDNPTFVRRCYWLLDKALEHIVLVHYRETQELQGSPITPLHSNSSSALSDPSVSWVLSDETNSGAAPACYTAEKAQEGPADSITFGNHEMRLHEINTLEWEELLAPDGSSKLSTPNEGKDACLEQQNQYETTEITSGGSISSANQLCQENSFRNFSEPVPRANSICFNLSDHACLQRVDSQSNSDLQSKVFLSMYMGNGCEPLNIMGKDRLQSQDSFEILMNRIMTDSPGSLDEQILQSSSPISHEVSTSPVMDHLQSSVPGKILSITDVSPAWAVSTEETKILITGIFGEGHLHLAKSDIYCVCGDVHVRVEIVQSGVFRCFVSPHTPGVVDLYLSFDGHNPISQVLTFEYRAPSTHDRMVSSEEKSKWEEFKVQMRLAHLLFSTSKRLSVMSSKVSANTLNEAKTFASRTSHIAAHWAYMIQSIEDNKISHKRAKDQLFELALMNRLYEWLLERILEGCKTSGRDDLGHGVIHLCAILDYRWAVYPYAWSGLSLDYRDKFGWTALHWAAYYGREKMAATLLSAGVKPYLVTDPTSENPGGCTAADLASKNGHDGLAAYLAEKSLLNHFEDMTIAGNVGGSLQTSTPHSVNLGSVSEEELYLKDSLTAYRTAADAAARIHAAFREHSFKLRTNAVQFSNPEDDARNIVAAMKIQNAFRNYETRKKMAAAARIQHRFRTCKIRKDFLTLRIHAIKIQAVFRGFQVRRQYRKIVWSVGVLEKAILRWRMKRKGFRGLKICPVEDGNVQEQEESVVEEAFFRASRKQAEERIERSVVRVQAMFRSKRAQQEYRRMKLAYNQARLEYEGFVSPEIDMS